MYLLSDGGDVTQLTLRYFVFFSSDSIKWRPEYINPIAVRYEGRSEYRYTHSLFADSGALCAVSRKLQMIS